jgi:hypothetical protein
MPARSGCTRGSLTAGLAGSLITGAEMAWIGAVSSSASGPNAGIEAGSTGRATRAGGFGLSAAPGTR